MRRQTLFDFWLMAESTSMRDLAGYDRFPPGRFFPTSAQILQWRGIARHTRQGRAARLLRRIEGDQIRRSAASAPEVRKLTWLLPYRAEIRRVVERREAAGILLYLAYCSPEMRPIGVWLLGHSADRFRLYELGAFCDDPSPKVRKHVANALRRHEAWHWLDRMAKTSPEDGIIQRIAARAVVPAAARPFGERLKKFGRNVDRSHAAEAAEASRMPFWASETSWEGVPPKTISLIRRLLRRIQRWVHGRAT